MNPQLAHGLRAVPWVADIFNHDVTAWLRRFRGRSSDIDLLPFPRDLCLAYLPDDARANFSRLTSLRLA